MEEVEYSNNIKDYEENGDGDDREEEGEKHSDDNTKYSWKCAL